MSEKEKKILETFGKVIPDLSDMEKEKLLSFGEGMAFMKGKVTVPKEVIENIVKIIEQKERRKK